MPDSRNTATGYLVVAVTTAQNAVPLENALVTVSSVKENGDSELLYTTRTNRSGQTAMLPLPAPPLSNSLSPGSSNELLYTTRTNRSGQTAMLPLPAPPLSNSLSPGSSNPYARYAVTVNLDGYQPVSTKDLTVFADVVATLPVYLIPLEEFQPVPAPSVQRPLPEHSLNTEELT